jgi:hypothetical protein
MDRDIVNSKEEAEMKAVMAKLRSIEAAQTRIESQLSTFIGLIAVLLILLIAWFFGSFWNTGGNAGGKSVVLRRMPVIGAGARL